MGLEANGPDCPLHQVRTSCEWVAERSEHVKLGKAITTFWESEGDSVKTLINPPEFDKSIHFVDGGPLTAQYMLCVDALNFCFWPTKGLEYEHLSCGIKKAVERDPHAIDAERLASIDEEGIRALFDWDGDVVPNAAERARLLREVGRVLQRDFGGQAATLIKQANKSASRLVELVTAHFPGFRDSALYDGRQVFLYKRAQIFVGDLWGAFGGKGLGEFEDMDRLTMFADYRVPVVLRKMGLLEYSSALSDAIERGEEIPSGSRMEVEIRACSVVAVERMREAFKRREGSRVCSARRDAFPGRQPVLSIQLDWLLWELGERSRETDAHHKTLSVFY